MNKKKSRIPGKTFVYPISIILTFKNNRKISIKKEYKNIYYL